MSNTEYRVLFKDDGSQQIDLWLFKIEGDVFHPIPNGLQASGPFTINDWRSLTEVDLAQKFAAKYGMWGGGGFMNPWSAPSVQSDQYRIRCANPLVGEYYVGMYRPVWNGRNNLLQKFPDIPFDLGNHELIRQIDRITENIFKAAEFIEPSQATINTFSVALREFLIIQCTEIETILQNLLRKHCVNPQSRNWNTVDYYKTCEPLRLKEYQVYFPTFQRLNHGFSPFFNWSDSQPTQSLVFYDEYNKTKHNRADGLESATFSNVLSSYAALLIVAFATCGPAIAKSQRLQNFISLKQPAWKIEDHYIPVFESHSAQSNSLSEWSSRSDYSF